MHSLVSQKAYQEYCGRVHGRRCLDRVGCRSPCPREQCGGRQRLGGWLALQQPMSWHNFPQVDQAGLRIKLVCFLGNKLRTHRLDSWQARMRAAGDLPVLWAIVTLHRSHTMASNVPEAGSGSIVGRPQASYWGVYMVLERCRTLRLFSCRWLVGAEGGVWTG